MFVNMFFDTAKA